MRGRFGKDHTKTVTVHPPYLHRVQHSVPSGSRLPFTTSSSKVPDGPALSHLPPWVKAKLRPLAIEKIQAVYDWVENECIPRETVDQAQLRAKKWAHPLAIKELRARAKTQGIFNLFLPNHFKESPGLTNLEYGCCAEIMGRCYWAA